MKVIWLLIFLAGCEASSKQNRFYDRTHIEIIILEDGTKCAVAKYPGGLDCDWETSE